jgi:hypothetical protein
MNIPFVVLLMVSAFKMKDNSVVKKLQFLDNFHQKTVFLRRASDPFRRQTNNFCFDRLFLAFCGVFCDIK